MINIKHIREDIQPSGYLDTSNLQKFIIILLFLPYLFPPSYITYARLNSRHINTVYVGSK